MLFICSNDEVTFGVKSCVYILPRDHKESTYAQRGLVKPKAYAPYKSEYFLYSESVQGGGGVKTGKIERTYFLDGPQNRGLGFR